MTTSPNSTKFVPRSSTGPGIGGPDICPTADRNQSNIVVDLTSQQTSVPLSNAGAPLIIPW